MGRVGYHDSINFDELYQRRPGPTAQPQPYNAIMPGNSRKQPARQEPPGTRYN